MTRVRVMPCLLLRGHGLVKTRKFKDPVYLGDPVNAVRIFSEKEVDELIVLDIDASKDGREPDYDFIAEIAGESFMPIAYGGGIRTVEQVRRLIRCGVEKVVINTASTLSYDLIRESAQVFGRQAVVGAIDVKKTLFGAYRVMVQSATVEAKVSLDEHVQNLVTAGVGEVFLNSVDRDGTMQGYDLSLIRRVAQQLRVPLVACGGAGTTEHLAAAVHEGGASAVAAGSMFVFHGRLRAVLLNYPQGLDLRR
ncbi:MAG: imidazole glycerol phosphate synthase subunit HisF [Pseudomonadota bacterium]